MSFAVGGVAAELDRFRELGVRFTEENHSTQVRSPTAVCDDTCGNLIQIAAEH